MPRRGCGLMQRGERRGWLAALGRSRGWWHAEWAKAGLRARGEAGFALAAELGRSGTRARLRWSSGRGASWAEGALTWESGPVVWRLGFGERRERWAAARPVSYTHLTLPTTSRV